MNRSKILLASLALATLSGCVSASKHKEEVGALQAQVDQEKAAIQAGQTENMNLKKAITDMEQKLATNAKDRGHMQSTIDDMTKALAEMRQRQAEQKARLQEFKDLSAKFKSLTDSGSLSVKMIDGKMVVSLGSDVLFSSGSAKLSNSGRDELKEVAKQLATIPGKRYQIEGHTDNIPISTAMFPSNWELASARALNVLRAMVDSGMPADHMSAASFGDTQPIKGNDSPEARAANRRIAIVVVPDLSSLPGYEELNKLSSDN